MRARSGAGASVSSGASYQARVGAYLVVSLLCKMENTISVGKKFEQLSFETIEAVDDINIVHADGAVTYIQAKATITYSLNKGGELRSVVEQFVTQEPKDDDRLLLVTSGRASKKVIYDLRYALEAFRTSSVKAFFRDQPESLKEIIEQITSTIRTLKTGAAKTHCDKTAYDLIRKIRVVALDLETSDSLEQALILNLASKGCVAAEAVWGKIVSDCVTYSKNRKTILAKDLIEQYSKYLSSPKIAKVEAIQRFFKIEKKGGGLCAGRDVFLCDLPLPLGPLPAGLAIIETYRFKGNCDERLQFENDVVIFGNGFKAPLLRRAATYEGLARLVKSRPDLVGEREVNVCPIDSKENFDASPCAKIHAQRLDQAFQDNTHPLHCVICGKAVSANNASIIELEPLENPTVGLCHEACLKPSFRVLGRIQGEFFTSYEELVNFDAEAWYRAINGGQKVFSNADALAGGSTKVILWGGCDPKGPDGAYVVEISLVGGACEIVTKRNGVHRFSKDGARVFSDQLNGMFKQANANGDPYCYTDQSKGFGTRSQLLEMFGVSEVILPVERAWPRAFDVRIAAQYSRPGQWYAPLLYLRSLETGHVFSLKGAVFLISEPLKFGIFLKNWQEIGLVAENYEVSTILTDTAFDEFMRWCDANGETVIVDPLFAPSSCALISGYPVESIYSLSKAAGS